MRVPGFETAGAPGHEDEKKNPFLHRLAQLLYKFAENITAALNGNLTFGDGSSSDNIAGKWISYTTNAAADTEDAVAHNLGIIPPGFLVMVPPGSGFLYKGSTSWTTANIYIKCSQAAQPVVIFVLSEPRTM